MPADDCTTKPPIIIFRDGDRGLFVIGATYHRPMPHDRGSGPYRDGKPLPSDSLWQNIENESWPLRDKDGKRHARGINDRPIEQQRAVTVRLVFEHDGEAFLPGRASRWNATHVYVIVSDPRVRRMAVWVKAEDVRRA